MTTSPGFAAPPQFDPYATQISPPPLLGGIGGSSVLPPVSPYGTSIGGGQPAFPSTGAPAQINPAPPGSLGAPGGYPGAYPSYNGAAPILPGSGQSATVGTFNNGLGTYPQTGVYPNSPSALFPGTSPTYPSQGMFGNVYSSIFGAPAGGLPPYPGTGYQNGAPVGYPPGAYQPNWNPQGTVFTGTTQYPQFIRFFQGPRFRHAYIHGNNDADSLMINDSDLALAFAWPNFLFSTQPLYLMPSFSLHQWAGPKQETGADLPAIAYSAFLDTGWQSDPGRIWGAELGLRMGMFSDFDTATSDSFRIMGRGIGRVRLTPRATLKAGVLYLDRNKVELLPAGGLLWQPNPDTRFDLFFPEPKLAHFLSTVGTTDTWWYVGGYYGGGAWTVKRTNGTSDSVDINDLRLVLGLEWGRSEQMRDGRRTGFLEIGYVFDRELVYKATPMDNIDLQDTIMVRAGFGF